MDWDVFISHAREDKEDIAKPLAEALRQKRLRVWYDDFTLRVGDSLRRSIDHGLANSRYGIVILSPNFFAKEWPQKELDGLAAREVHGERVILPVWHNVTADQVREYSPTLADRYAAKSDRSFEHVVEELLRVVRPASRMECPSFEPEMILIPAGEFLMGSDPKVDENATDREQPQHTLSLPEYYLAKTLVTNVQYAAFVQDTDHKPPPHWEGDQYPEGLSEHPVVNVRWSDAVAYCRWLSKKMGKPYRLPSEAEWEKAARGTNGRRFPWGNEWDVSKCNTRDDGPGTTTPVGQYSPDGDSPYGVTDMAGNVWEWCADWLEPYPGNSSPDDDYGEMHKVLRGSSWDTYGPARCAFRYARRPGEPSDDIGFRCVKGSPATRVKAAQRFQEDGAKRNRIVVVQSLINEVVRTKKVIEHYNSREFSAASGAPQMPVTAFERALAPGLPDLAASKELVDAISDYLIAADSINSLVDIHLTRGGSLEEFAMRQDWASLSEILDRLDDCLKRELESLQVS